VVVETPQARLVFSTLGGSLRSFKLKDYSEIDPPLRLLEAQRDSATTAAEKEFWQTRLQEVQQRLERTGKLRLRKGEPVPESAWVELVPTYVDTTEYPLILHFGTTLSDKALVYQTATENRFLQEGEVFDLVFQGATQSGLVITKKITLSADRPQIEIEVKTEAPNGLNTIREKIGSQFVLEWPDGLAHLPFRYPGAQEENQLRALLNDSMQSPTLNDWMRKQALAAGQTQEFRYPLDGRVGWVCIETRYFIATLIPQGANMQGVFRASGLVERPSVDTRLGIGLVGPVEENPQKFTLYVGPKLTSILTQLGGGLDRVVYDSWFGSICLLVEWLLGIFYRIIPSYGIAIVLLCILSKVVLYPLTYKQAQMQMKMAELQPKIAELKERFKDDNQKLSQEQMKLWKKHGVNPASGCLPMLAQLPIFIALYRTIQSSIDLRGAPFLWIPDLSLPDMTFFLPSSLPFLGNAINILPVVMTLVSLWQMREQKKMMPDPNQAQMMMFMTVFFFFILYHFSSGLVLYWLTNSLTQMIQQKIMEHLGHAVVPAGGKAVPLPVVKELAEEATLTTDHENEKEEGKLVTFRRQARPGKRKGK
jgi:YidC/Oxa1 family membrane protein insertase